MKRFNTVLTRIEDIIAVILLTAMVLILFAQVILRTFGLPLKWTEESARFLFIALVYIGISMAVRSRRHLSVDIVPLMLNDTGKSVLQIIADLISLIFFAVVVFFGMQVLHKLYIQPQRSQAIGMNMVIPYAAPYIGSALAVLRYIMDIINEISVMRKRSVAEE